MLTIRSHQLGVFEEAQAQHFLLHLMAHVRTHFPEEVGVLDDALLRARIEQGVRQGHALGLVTRRDLSRFINLLVASDWEFARAPEHAWMKDYLEDPGVSSPSVRLERLVQEFIRRGELEARNAVLREEFGQ
ncbi:hypothetical protein F0U60_53765 [Archangium minus]|uniref:Uncharacterized protein n=1 Tax=Archangium minus TaxID=83450 RepID=A0ABY9X9C0_9BACT|nr:hypothetical protein F0U60_53765 [Archangium minus]